MDECIFHLITKEKTPFRELIFKMAQSVGFEPTCLLGQLDFESSSLWPLRYDCMNLLVHYSKLLIPPQDLAFTLR